MSWLEYHLTLYLKTKNRTTVIQILQIITHLFEGYVFFDCTDFFELENYLRFYMVIEDLEAGLQVRFRNDSEPSKEL